MMVLKHTSWENQFKLDAQKLSVLAAERPAVLWKYCVDLANQSDGGTGDFILTENLSERTFEKFCVTELNIAGLMLNTKKLQTALIKKCSELALSPELENQLTSVYSAVCKFCGRVSGDVGYSVELNEDFDAAGLFKLVSLTFKESFGSLLEKLIEYVNIHTEFLKTKIFIFLFLTKFLTPEETTLFFEHCRYQGISLVLLEESFPQFLSNSEIPYQALIVDCDGCEITKGM